MKKASGDTIILHMCTINENRMMYGSWDFFSMEMNICTINIKTTVTWHHDYYGCQGYKKSNNQT